MQKTGVRRLRRPSCEGQVQADTQPPGAQVCAESLNYFFRGVILQAYSSARLQVGAAFVSERRSTGGLPER
jgi:hypothetical protein